MNQYAPAVFVPASLREGAGSTAKGAAWLEQLPSLVARAVQRWSLRLTEPFGVGTTAWTAPGVMPDGTPVVLKITFPHEEAQYEAAALRAWHGYSAVELLDHHGPDWAILMRRAHPGTLMLHDHSPAQVRLRTGLELIANLHRAPVRGDELPLLRHAAARWTKIATDRANRWAHLYEHYRQEMQYGLGLLAGFADHQATPAPMVGLHGDLNPGNILLDAPVGGPGHWLAIDPKPMLGDPAYDLWPMLAQVDSPFGYPDPMAVLAPRVEMAEQILGVPARRICQWACARAVEAVLWQLETWPDPADQRSALGELPAVRCWAQLAQR